ncbi:eukaryotic translation initiation factor eIF2A-domain-containing protein [Zopfochytrium polystomum]|nr:eukaryotic translation initiation factor eIF2A-domain-containing protein [Zopfochytrium polystomum]
MPDDPVTKKSKGFLFMEFETPEQAIMAVKYGDGHVLDKNHVFSVNRYEDFEKFLAFPEEFTPPKIEPYQDRPHLRSWLKDEKLRDQWVLVKGDQVGVYWNNKADQPDLIKSGENWSETYVQWSPLGTYMVTFHKPGVKLWSGPNFEVGIRFAHPQVRLIDFSPNERYLVTWSHDPITTETGDHHHVVIWDTQTGLQLRSFPVDPSTFQVNEAGGRNPAATVKIDWPMFKWSHDSKYVARMTPGKEGAIYIYETPGMGLLDKKSIKIENLKSFDWSPSENVLSYWTAEPEVGQIPARVTLIRVPSRELVRTKNLFGVVNATLHWQSEGKYLLTKIERAKTKKQIVVSLEVFRMKEKDVPVDVVELNQSESHVNVFWEPKGDRFALVSAEAPGAPRMSVHFYHMGGAAASYDVGGAKLVRSLERKGINQVIWSPKGRIAVLAGIRDYQGGIEFWDADEQIVLGSGEHYKCTDAEWDPSGRYLVTSVSWWRVQTDPGFTMWTNTGQTLTQQMVPQFKQFLWRPRPPTLLSAERQKEILKKLKTYSKEFDKIDESQTDAVNRELIEKRLALWREWVAYRRRCEDDWTKEAPLRLEIVGFDLEEDAKQGIREVEEFVDEVIDEVEELVKDDEDYD